MKWFSKAFLLLVSCNVYATSQSGNFYLTGQVGLQKANSHDSTIINNGFASPNNLDIYSVTDQKNAGLFGIQAGYRWQHISLGLLYQHNFASDVNGQVTQFSLPQFTNYNYTWQTKSNLILAQSKINFFDHQQFSPFINLGLGSAFHHGKYTETPLANVTARISPQFSSHSNAQLAAQLGAGLDYQFNPNWIGSVAYQYTHLGKLISGKGSNSWSSENLNFGHYHANALLTSLTYLFSGI